MRLFLFVLLLLLFLHGTLNKELKRQALNGIHRLEDIICQLVNLNIVHFIIKQKY